MGVNLKDLIAIKKEIAIEQLSGKVLAVDAFNTLYQFLTTIRAPDGSLFTDSKGCVTSHLIGLFNRTLRMMEANLKLVFVFDGEPPELKAKELHERKERKIEAALQYEAAKEREDIEEMKKYAGRTSVLTKEMVEESKRLLHALGIPTVQAPSEGEAQTTRLVKNGDAYASVSQDYDNLLFGCPLLIRNLSVEGRKKLPGKLAYKTVEPEMISLKENLGALGITNDQLIALAMLVGTDFNPGGVHGIGPKTALKLVKEHADLDALFIKAEWNKHFTLPWRDIFDVIKHMPVTDDYSLRWGKINAGAVQELLVEEHNFSAERVEKRLAALLEQKEKKQQTGLGKWA